MKLYLAFKDSETFMEGTFENCVGVFDSLQRAWDFLRTTYNFDKSKLSNNGFSRVYHVDGELSYHWYVKEVELNKPI